MFQHAMHSLNYLSLRYRQRGLTTVEYAVAGSLIALAVVVAFRTLGGTVNTKITDIDTELNK